MNSPNCGGPRIRSLEKNVTEERQRGLPSLPAHDPRFPQPPICLAPKSSSDRNRVVDKQFTGWELGTHNVAQEKE